jgi:hypothetical protein
MPPERSYVSFHQQRTCRPLGSPPLCANRRPEQVQQRAWPQLRLLDHLVGTREQSRRYLDADRLGSFEVDYEFKARRLDNRQVGGFLTFEDAPSIPSCFSTDFIPIRAVTHQAAFWCAFEEGEVTVIGDKPTNTDRSGAAWVMNVRRPEWEEQS